MEYVLLLDEAPLLPLFELLVLHHKEGGGRKCSGHCGRREDEATHSRTVFPQIRHLTSS